MAEEENARLGGLEVVGMRWRTGREIDFGRYWTMKTCHRLIFFKVQINVLVYILTNLVKEIEEENEAGSR
jgi:hypothetical protein